MYEAVSGQKLTKCDVIKNKDGDETNIAFDNLYIEKRKNVMLKHFTPEQRLSKSARNITKRKGKNTDTVAFMQNPPIMKCATSITAP